MTTHTIEIEGLPEGWKAVAIKLEELEGSDSEHAIYIAKVIAEKIQPRRIVLEETGEERSVSYGDWYEDEDGNVINYLNKSFGTRKTYKIWKEVKE